MIKKIIYQVRFPFLSVFSYDPYFLFIKKIYQYIKDLTCLNDLEKCINCPHHNKCIYYILSGNNFEHSSGIIIKRGLIEKNHFNNNEVINLEFTLIGSAIRFEGFIIDYFKNHEFLEKNYYQKVLISSETIPLSNNYTGPAHIKTPLKCLDNFTTEINFISTNYNIDLPNDIKITNQGTKTVKDYNIYYINTGKVINSGEVGIINIDNYPKELLLFGIGNNNVIGGGKIDAN